MTTMTGCLCNADRTPSRRPLAPPQVADGTRVAKGRISAWSCDPGVNGFQTTSDCILGPPYENCREQSVEMGVDANNSMVWQHTNVYAAGKLLATYDGVPVDRSSSTGQDNDGLHFYFNDPLPGSPAIGLRRWGGLGTRRAQTDYAGVLEQTCSSRGPHGQVFVHGVESLPFGDGLACSGGNLQAPTEHHFTGKERDTESGNDYFGARYYASSMGRWMSPDKAFADQHVANPQSWNLYSYTRNNPLNSIDFDGLSTITFDGRAHTITVYSAGGIRLVSFRAYNNVEIRNYKTHDFTNGPITNGPHAVIESDQHGAVRNLGNSPNGMYGPNGIIHVEDYDAVTFHKATVVGLHAGRKNKRGPEHPTDACIRTTDEAMSFINYYAGLDPLTEIDVQNNEQNIANWATRAEDQGDYVDLEDISTQGSHNTRHSPPWWINDAQNFWDDIQRIPSGIDKNGG
jgi:RHS repeat-associated protein